MKSGPGPQPPGLQYERVACLEKIRTEEMRSREEGGKKAWKNWINDRLACVCVCVRALSCRYACESVCVSVSVCVYICENPTFATSCGQPEGGGAGCRRGGAMPCVYVD